MSVLQVLWETEDDVNDAFLGVELGTGELVLETYHWGRDCLLTMHLSEDEARGLAGAVNTWLGTRCTAWTS